MSNPESNSVNPYVAPETSSDLSSVPATTQTSAEPSFVPLARNASFWGMTTTQFLGAFNDNLYKQLVLLLAVPIAAVGQKPVVEGPSSDVQGWATLVFALPFVIFSGYAGFLSDKFSKRNVIVLAKVAEIVIMSLSVFAFLYYSSLGMSGTWTVLFLMGTHSAFFGPGKYGILPELFPKKQLANANGVVLMTTFLAIILGTLAAGALSERYKNGSPLWEGSVVCVAIAVVGTFASLLVKKTRPAQPRIKLTPDALFIDRQVGNTIWRDRPLLSALLVSSVFWLISGICVPVINRVGRLLLVDDFQTSLLAGAIAFGIMLGSVIAITFQSMGITNARRQVFIGLWGMAAMLAALSIWQGALPFLSYWAVFGALLILGVFVATYAIPLQVFLQDRPPDEIKGRMIATMNQANFIGIMLSGPLYQLFQSIAGALKLPINTVFGMMALLILPLAIFYRLNDSPKPNHENAS